MTVHLSPSVRHGLRLVTIGFGLASSGLLAVPAHAQHVRARTDAPGLDQRAVRPDGWSTHAR